MNVSKGIPALPPKSGCMVCAGPHSAADCAHTAVLGLSRFEASKIHERQVYRNFLVDAAARRDAPAKEPADYYARLSDAVNADQDDTNARARRRMGVGR